MFTGAAILFALAAIGGLTSAYLHFTRNSVPTGLAVVHGLLAAAGLVLLIIGIASGPAAGLIIASLVIFLVAALGGFVLFFGFQLRKKPLLSPLVVIHQMAAVTAFVLLLIFLFRRFFLKEPLY
jgi:hypothetical protein